MPSDRSISGLRFAPNVSREWIVFIVLVSPQLRGTTSVTTKPNHQNGTCDYFLSIKNTEHAKNCLKVIILHAFNVFYTSISEQDPINIMAGRNNSPPDDQQRRSTRKRIKPEKLVMEVKNCTKLFQFGILNNFDMVYPVWPISLCILIRSVSRLIGSQKVGRKLQIETNNKNGGRSKRRRKMRIEF